MVASLHLVEYSASLRYPQDRVLTEAGRMGQTAFGNEQMHSGNPLAEGCENPTRLLPLASERAARTKRLTLCPTSLLLQAPAALLTLVLLLFCLLSLTVRAAIPAAATNDARYALGYLVVTNYPNVRNDGITDCTAGLRTAIQDAFNVNKTFQSRAINGTPANAGRPLTVWFPPGTYKITNVLECYSWTDGVNHPPGGAFVLVGSTEGATRPRIVLAAGATSYQATNPPRPMISFRIFAATNGTPIPVPDPMSTPSEADDISSALFNCDLRNIDLDCNGNPGAMGVVLSGAQYCSIENVRIFATNAFGGFYELPGAGGYAANVEVYGGRYGIIHGRYSPLGLNITAGGSGAVMVGIKLQDQTVAPILIGDGVATPTIVGFQFLNSQTVTIPYYGAAGGGTCYGTLTLLDGQISMSGSGNLLAIDNTTNKNLYIRNVYISNTTNLVQSGTTTTTTGTGAWRRVIEYAYNSPKDVAGVPPNSGYPNGEDTLESWSMVNGTARDRTTTFPVSPSVTNNCEAPPANLLSRHVWSTLPSYNGAATDPATVVVSSTAGLNNTNDDTAVIQAAIESARSGNGRVYVPAGLYYLTNTLTLHSNTMLMGAGWKNTWIQAAPAWKPTSGEAVMMQTDNDANALTTLAWLSLHTRTIGNTETNYSRFNDLTWQAGRNSMLIGVATCETWQPMEATQARSVVKYTGHGGGRWWGLAVSGSKGMLHPGFRHLKISGTAEPLWVYGCNIEHGLGDMDGEVTGASNVRLLGLKREGTRPMLVITNSSNIGAYSGGALRGNPEYNGLFQVLGASSNVLIANLNVHYGPGGEGSSDYMLYEAINGQPVTNILHPNNVSLYKRGELNDAIMIIGGGAPNTNPSFRVQAISMGPPLTLSVLSSSNWSYTLWSSPSLPPAWTPVPGQVDIPGNGELLELRDTNTAPAQFYRVSVAN